MEAELLAVNFLASVFLTAVAFAVADGGTAVDFLQPSGGIDVNVVETNLLATSLQQLAVEKES